MENYSKHLESVVEARTLQVMEEKQRTDALLYSELALFRLRPPPEYFHFSLAVLIPADGCMPLYFHFSLAVLITADGCMPLNS